MLVKLATSITIYLTELIYRITPYLPHLWWKPTALGLLLCHNILLTILLHHVTLLSNKESVNG